MSAPKKYKEEDKIDICAKVFDYMINRGLSERKIFREHKKELELCGITLFREWCLEPDIAMQYARASKARREFMFDEMQEIADDGTNDFKTNQHGDEVLNTEHVQRSKLRIDTRKWMLGKMSPKEYGDRVTHEGDAEKPFTIIHLGGGKDEEK